MKQTLNPLGLTSYGPLGVFIHRLSTLDEDGKMIKKEVVLEVRRSSPVTLNEAPTTLLHAADAPALITLLQSVVNGLVAVQEFNTDEEAKTEETK